MNTFTFSKKVLLKLSFLAVIMGANAQTELEDCSDLFISEIVFDNPIANAKLSSVQEVDYKNVIELYNPTQDNIDLSDYSLVLTPDNGSPIIQYLYGTINAEETALISNFNSNSDITSVAQVVSSLLDFNGKVKIELKKDGVIKDRIGQINPQNVEAVQIDIAELLNNPLYLNGQHVDLRSIESLNIRRASNVRKGSLVFDPQAVVSEWFVYPTTSLSDLGQHNSTCNIAEVDGYNLVAIEGVNMVSIESSEVTAEIKLRSGGASQLAEGYGSNRDVYVDLVMDQNIPSSATPNADFVPNEQFNLHYVAFPNSASNPNLPVNLLSYDIMTVTDDNIVEGNENITFKVNVLPTTQNFVYFTFDAMEAVILDDDDPNTPIGITSLEENSIDVYPTMTNGLLHIESEVEFTKGWISNDLGVAVMYFNKEDNVIDLSSIPSGYYNIHFFSKTLYTTGKIIKL